MHKEKELVTDGSVRSQAFDVLKQLKKADAGAHHDNEGQRSFFGRARVKEKVEATKKAQAAKKKEQAAKNETQDHLRVRRGRRRQQAKK